MNIPFEVVDLCIKIVYSKAQYKNSMLDSIHHSIYDFGGIKSCFNSCSTASLAVDITSFSVPIISSAPTNKRSSNECGVSSSVGLNSSNSSSRNC